MRNLNELIRYAVPSMQSEDGGAFVVPSCEDEKELHVIASHGQGRSRQMATDQSTRSWLDKEPDELIAEFHATCDVKPGNVTFEDSLIVFRYPKTGMKEDRLTRARLQEIIDAHRERVSGK